MPLLLCFTFHHSAQHTCRSTHQILLTRLTAVSAKCGTSSRYPAQNVARNYASQVSDCHISVRSLMASVTTIRAHDDAFNPNLPCIQPPFLACLPLVMPHHAAGNSAYDCYHPSCRGGLTRSSASTAGARCHIKRRTPRCACTHDHS